MRFKITLKNKKVKYKKIKRDKDLDKNIKNLMNRPSVMSILHVG